MGGKCLYQSHFLHCLPVSQRVVFKTALMVWKCVNDVAPAYISDLCIPATATSGREKLRSASSRTLVVPRVRTVAEQRSFAVNGPTTWNSLPPALRAPELSQNAFIHALKTHLFSTARHRWDILTTPAPNTNALTYLLNTAIQYGDTLFTSPKLKDSQVFLTKSDHVPEHLVVTSDRLSCSTVSDG